MRHILLTVALLISAAPSLADVLLVGENAGVVTALSYDALTPAQLQGNMNATQLALDKATTEGRTLVLPPTLFMDGTLSRPFLRVRGSVKIEAAPGGSLVRFGPDNAWQKGFNSRNYALGFLRWDEGVSGVVEINGVEIVGPIAPHAPALGVGANPLLTPTYGVMMAGHYRPGVVKTLILNGTRFRRLEMAVECGGDNLTVDRTGSSVSIRASNIYAEDVANVFSVFGSQKSVWINGLYATGNWVYPDGSGTGNKVSCHQGVNLFLNAFYIKGNRAAVKYAGVTAQGSSDHGIISNGVISGTNTGIHLDRFQHTQIRNVYFERTLSTAVQLEGSVDMQGCTVACPSAFSAISHGGTAPRVSVSSTWFLGARSIFHPGLWRNPVVSFSDCWFVDADDPLGVLFSSNAGTGGRYTFDRCVFIPKALDSVVDPSVDGTWRFDRCDFLNGNPPGTSASNFRIGLVRLTANPPGTLIFEKCHFGFAGPMFYHAAQEAWKARVVVRD